MPIERQGGVDAGIPSDARSATRFDQRFVCRFEGLLLIWGESLDPRVRGYARPGGELLRVAGEALDYAEGVELFAGCQRESSAGGFSGRLVEQNGLPRAVER